MPNSEQTVQVPTMNVGMLTKSVSMSEITKAKRNPNVDKIKKPLP